MKKVLLLIALMYYFHSHAQIKKDNTIIIHENLEAKKISEVLFDHGYIINKTDSGYISTDPIKIKDVNMRIAMQKKDSAWTIKAWGKPAVIISENIAWDYTLIYYGGAKSSPLRNAWDEMVKIAKQLSDKIEYAKQ